MVNFHAKGQLCPYFSWFPISEEVEFNFNYLVICLLGPLS